MDLLVIAKKIYDDCTDTIQNISSLSAYYPDLSTIINDDNRIVDQSTVDNLVSLAQEYPNGFTLMNGSCAIPLFVEDGESVIKLKKNPSDAWVNITNYENFKYFVNKVIKGQFSNLEDFTDYFTYDYEIDSWSHQYAAAIWETSETFFDNSLIDGTDDRSIYQDLINYFDGVLNSDVTICTLSKGNRQVVISSPLTDYNNNLVNVDELFERYNTALETQNIMKLISEQVLQGHSSRSELTGLLSTCKNSYSNAGAEIIEQFLNTLQEDSPFAFISSLYQTYMNMKNTTIKNDELSFYNDDLITSFAFTTVLRSTLSALSGVLSSVLAGINPVVGAIVYAFKTGFDWITGSINGAESVSFDLKAVNRCFGYPLVQAKVAANIRNYCFATYAYNQELVTVINPLMYYTAWTDPNKANILYEAFPKVVHSKETLQHVLHDMVGYLASMSGSGYEFVKLTTTQVRDIWKYLSQHEESDVYQYMSDDDQRYCLNAVMILAIILGNDSTINVLSNHNEYNDSYPDVSAGNDLNYRLIHYPSNWSEMYEYYQYYAAQCSNSIVTDSLIVGENWYDLCDVQYNDADGIPIDVLNIYSKTFWDRNNMYAKPPKYRKGSILFTICAITVAVAAIATTALIIKRKIENKQRLKYAQINAKQSAIQDGLKDGTITTSEANIMLSEVRKDTKRYNRIAKLTHSSTLSYYSGWENGDSSTKTADDTSNAVSGFVSSNEVYRAITGTDL